jgi:hypothetical protein
MKSEAALVFIATSGSGAMFLELSNAVLNKTLKVSGFCDV